MTTPETRLDDISHLKPGKNLNNTVDTVFRDGVDTSRDLKEQLDLLLFIHAMSTRNEVRLGFDEVGRLYGMIRVLKEEMSKIPDLNAQLAAHIHETLNNAPSTKETPPQSRT